MRRNPRQLPPLPPILQLPETAQQPVQLHSPQRPEEVCPIVPAHTTSHIPLPCPQRPCAPKRSVSLFTPQLLPAPRSGLSPRYTSPHTSSPAHLRVMSPSLPSSPLRTNPRNTSHFSPHAAPPIPTELRPKPRGSEAPYALSPLHGPGLATPSSPTPPDPSSLIPHPHPLHRRPFLRAQSPAPARPRHGGLFIPQG